MVGGVLVSPSLAQTVGLADWVGLPIPHSCRYCGTNPGFDFLLESLSWYKPWLVVGVVGGGVQSFFLRVMVGTGYPHPAQCEFAYPPVYVDYIIILSYVEWTAVYRFHISGLRKRIVVGGE